MEARSSRHLGTLVTRMANSGLSANEIAGALISMMARSKCSNQRPDTLMQDRYHQLEEVLLREFIAYLKAHQSMVSEANVGVGSSTHTFCTLLQSLPGPRTWRIPPPQRRDRP